MVQRIRRAVNRYSKGIVLLCITMTTLYTVAVLVLCVMEEQMPPAELTVGVFAMYTVEFGSLAAIKINDKEDDDGEAEE